MDKIVKKFSRFLISRTKKGVENEEDNYTPYNLSSGFGFLLCSGFCSPGRAE